MKINTFLKGCLGLVLIYLVCLPIMSVKIDIPPKNKKVSICPTIRGRIISPDDKKYWDGYFRMEDLKLLATKKGSLSPSKVSF